MKKSDLTRRGFLLLAAIPFVPIGYLYLSHEGPYWLKTPEGWPSREPSPLVWAAFLCVLALLAGAVVCFGFAGEAKE